MCALITCAKCCSIFSVFGIVFLILIGILLEYQPDYVRGPEHKELAAQGCYNGALIYFGTLVLSLLYWGFDEMKNRGRVLFSSSSTSAAATSRRGPTPMYGSTK